MLFTVVLFFLFVIVSAVVFLVFTSKQDIRKKKPGPGKDGRQPTEDCGSGPEYHVDALIAVEMLADGIYAAGGVYCGIGKIDGTNFSVMSETDQNNREHVFIDILTGIDYPVQFITTTIVADTGRTAKEVAAKWLPMPENTLKTYAALYAKALDEMQAQRQILSQSSWLVLTDDGSEGDPAEKIKEKMGLLTNALRQRAGVIFTPLFSMEEAVDVFGQILNPESLNRPSDYLAGLSAIHVAESEVLKHAAAPKTESYAT